MQKLSHEIKFRTKLTHDDTHTHKKVNVNQHKL